MNLRVGSFGRQEGAAIVLLSCYFSACFSFDSRALFENGKIGLPMLNIVVIIMMIIIYAELLIKKLGSRSEED